MKNNVKNNLVALHHGVCTYCHNLLFFSSPCQLQKFIQITPQEQCSRHFTVQVSKARGYTDWVCCAFLAFLTVNVYCYFFSQPSSLRLVAWSEKKVKVKGSMRDKVHDSEDMMENTGSINTEENTKGGDREVKLVSVSGGLQLQKVTLRYRQGCSFKQAGSRAVRGCTRVVVDPWRAALQQME